MRKQYKIPKHIRSYIKSELYNYEFNKKKLKQLEDDIINSGKDNDGQPRGNQVSDTTAQKAEKLITSRSILIVTAKIRNVERALSKLDEEDRKVVELIFFKGHNQVYAQMHDNISKDMYYDIMNKMIYLTAVEYGEI